ATTDTPASSIVWNVRWWHTNPTYREVCHFWPLAEEKRTLASVDALDHIAPAVPQRCQANGARRACDGAGPAVIAARPRQGGRPVYYHIAPNGLVNGGDDAAPRRLHTWAGNVAATVRSTCGGLRPPT